MGWEIAGYWAAGLVALVALRIVAGYWQDMRTRYEVTQRDADMRRLADLATRAVRGVVKSEGLDMDQAAAAVAAVSDMLPEFIRPDVRLEADGVIRGHVTVQTDAAVLEILRQAALEGARDCYVYRRAEGENAGSAK